MVRSHASTRTPKHKGCDMISVLRAVALIIGSFAIVAALVPSAQAQEGEDAGDEELEEVIVTSTRQTASVNRVPLAVTAQTQKALDQQGVQTIADLQALVPG